MNAHKRHKMAKMARFMAGKVASSQPEKLEEAVAQLPPEPEVVKTVEPVAAEVVAVDVMEEAVVQAQPEPEVIKMVEPAVVEKPVSKKKKSL